MYRRTFIFSLIGSLCVTGSPAHAWSLISKEEFEREEAAARIAEAPAVAQPGAPVISVDEPDDTKPVSSPVTIRISFHPQQGATIDTKSFRATYGFLGIDITQRIIDNAEFSASGLFAKNAQLPSGHHQVTLQIADNLRRVGNRTIEFTIA